MKKNIYLLIAVFAIVGFSTCLLVKCPGKKQADKDDATEQEQEQEQEVIEEGTPEEETSE